MMISPANFIFLLPVGNPFSTGLFFPVARKGNRPVRPVVKYKPEYKTGRRKRPAAGEPRPDDEGLRRGGNL